MGTVAGTIVRAIPFPLVNRAMFGIFQCMHLFFMAEDAVSRGTGLLHHVRGGAVGVKNGNPADNGAVFTIQPLCHGNIAPARVNWFSTALARDSALAYGILFGRLVLTVFTLVLVARISFASFLVGVGVHSVDRVQNPPVLASRDKHCLNSEPIPIMGGMCVLIRGLHKVCKRSLWTLSTLERGTLAPLPFFLWLAGMSLRSRQFAVETMVWLSCQLHFVRAVAGGKIDLCRHVDLRRDVDVDVDVDVDANDVDMMSMFVVLR